LESTNVKGVAPADIPGPSSTPAATAPGAGTLADRD
jgi:hypothetical protein